jgi:hypothetical protein
MACKAIKVAEFEEHNLKEPFTENLHQNKQVSGGQL